MAANTPSTYDAAAFRSARRLYLATAAVHCDGSFAVSPVSSFWYAARRAAPPRMFSFWSCWSLSAEAPVSFAAARRVCSSGWSVKDVRSERPAAPAAPPETIFDVTSVRFIRPQPPVLL